MSAYYLGIDVSKGYADFVILDTRQQVVEQTFQLDDTFEGHHRLYQILTRFVETHCKAQLFAGLESTGGYENNWLEALRRFQSSLPLKAARLNPGLVHNHVKAGGARVTTDATSAYYVATYLMTHPQKVHYHEHDSLASLRAQWTFIEQLKKQHTALLNQFESVLYRAHPELVTHLSGGPPAWLLKLLKRYPTAQRLARARPQTLAQIPYVSLERAKTLVEGARQSVASACDGATEHLVRELARQVRHLDGLIKKQEALLSHELELPEELALLKSFGRIGDYSAIGLLLEIETVERFASAKKMAAFFGVHPVFKQSGDGLGAMRMSKQGSSRMRSLLYMITLGAIQDHELIAPLYERLVEEQGMAKMAALGVCMHKTLRILYGLLKHRQRFDPEIERRHRAGSRTKQSRAPLQRKRRYQDYDPAAPISRRAKKRRHPQKDSQGALGTKCGMLTPAAAPSSQRRARAKSSLKEQPISA